jgi:5-(carboxyamino)imidazole ribonucleotide mutase
MTTPFVSIFMGSASDLETMRACTTTLEALGIKYEVKISSAHRTPAQTVENIKDAEKRGCAVFIAAAGLAAHLAGAVAANTIKPVIGVPINASGAISGGLDALLSTAQMPGGIPVATVAVGKAGAKNAAFLAAQILAVTDSNIADNLKNDRAAQAKKIAQANADLA